MANGILSPEEGQAKLDELKRYYTDKAEFLKLELSIAKRDMTEAALTSATLAAGLSESVYNTSDETIKKIVDVFKNEGGHIAYTDAHVEWYTSLKDENTGQGMLKIYGETGRTFNISQAIRGGTANILKSNVGFE